MKLKDGGRATRKMRTLGPTGVISRRCPGRAAARCAAAEARGGGRPGDVPRLRAGVALPSQARSGSSEGEASVKVEGADLRLPMDRPVMCSCGAASDRSGDFAGEPFLSLPSPMRSGL